MKKFIKKYTSQIIIAVVVALLLLFIQPILIIIRDSIINFLIAISKTFSDYFYQLLSSRDNNLNSRQILYILIIIFYSGVVYFFITFKQASKDLLNSIGENNLTTGNSETIAQDNNSNIFWVSLVRSKRNVNRIYRLISTAMLFSAAYIIIQSLTIFAASSAISKFEHNLKIIQYKVDNSEVKKLEYQWAIIKNKSDFDEVNKLIQVHLDDDSINIKN